MEIKIHKDFDEIEKASKKRRNQFINLVVILFLGIYCVNENNNTIFTIMGWWMIMAGSLLISLRYILPKMLFVMNKKIYKSSKQQYLIFPQYR